MVWPLSTGLIKSVILRQPGGRLEVLGSFFQTGHTARSESDGPPCRGLRVAIWPPPCLPGEECLCDIWGVTDGQTLEY